VLASGTLLVAHPAQAQVLDSLVRQIDLSVAALPTIGSGWEDRLRTEQLLGIAPHGAYLLRSPESMAPDPRSGPNRVAVQLLLPEVRFVSNSAIPFSLNDGLLWSGRGTNRLASAGLRIRYGPVTATYAPEFAWSENREFEILPWPLYLGRVGRDRFGSLWYSEGGDIDLPHRFGDEPFSRRSMGQSSATIDAGPLVIGISNENQWWGPGLRNALVLSNNAPGFAHGFIRTSAPVRTRIGNFEAKWIVGGLRESAFFDTIPDNDLRSISGAAVTYSPVWDPRFTVGIARAVVGPADRSREAMSHSLRAFRSWERRDSVRQIAWEPATDQIFSLFGRWLLPADGAEVYFEWARHELPVSFRDFLLAPHHTQGYTIGSQWARPLRPGVFRVQAEMTNVEQSTTFKQRPFDPFYTGRAASHGYTHRGQVVGAAIGPGSSSQWLAIDLLNDRFRFGLFGSRIRWENDTFYATPSPDPTRGHRTPHAHDVSVLGGARGGVSLIGLDFGAEIAFARRLNYLFQNPDQGFGSEGAVDVHNRTLRLIVTPTRRPSLARRAEVQ